jgi:asparagine synthase (glutamine-hydrolysing)
MCGICGIVDLTGQHRADLSLVQQMCDLIRHRGPDGDGFYASPAHNPDVALGMRRLSIIDVEGSDQPLYNEDRTLALVFNGEIYNYRELRLGLLEGGHRLSTEGDGETIIHLYEDHGLDLFDHLRGMYAFALWDANARLLLLAVDHIGMKPLYLCERDGKLAFASEVKALFADESTPRDLNLDVLDTYLSFGYMIGDETLFQGIRRLPPGHALVAENGATRLHQHWQFDGPDRREETCQEQDIIDDARRLLADSVRLHLRSDVPLGLFLSGGIDSAAILALMAREAQGRIKTFCVGYDARTPDNELLQARHTAQMFQTEHHERVIDAETWWQGFEKYVYHHDEPNANPSAVSLLLLSEDTAKHVKVVLTGLGGDELFSGYGHHWAIPRMIHDGAAWGRHLEPLSQPLAMLEGWYPALKRWPVVGALPTYLPRLRQAMLPRDQALLRMHSFDGMVFSDALRKQLYGPELAQRWRLAQHKERTYSAIIARSWRDDPYNTAQALVINTWLTGNALLSQDKVTMASSLEARVPFFDPVLLKFAANIPPALRTRSNKYVLREAMRGDLNGFDLNRAKKPFGTPILAWFDHELSDRLHDLLLDRSALSRNLFNRPALDRLLKGHFSRRVRHEEVIFRLATLELWMQRFLTSAGRPAQAAVESVRL